MPSILVRALLTGSLLTGLATTQALALDGKAFVDAINASYGASGATLAYADADVSGDTVTLKGATFKLPEDKTLPAGDLVFTGVSETGDGGYKADLLTVPDIAYASGPTKVSVTAIRLEGIDIPPPAADAANQGVILYRTASTGPVNVTGEKGELFSATGIVAHVTPKDDNGGYATDATASGLRINLAEVKDPKMKAAVEALGYQTVTGTASLEGSWDAKSGRVELSKYALALDDVGTLSIGLDLGGYTRDFMASLKQMQETALAAKDDPKAQQALGIGMLGLSQQISLNGATIRFEDASVTKKVLDYVGGQQGVSGEQMAQAAKAMMPLALAKLNNPEFQQQVSTAIGAFLDDPKSLTIAAAPTNPLPFAMIMGAGMAAPQTLPQVLGVKVTAND